MVRVLYLWQKRYSYLDVSCRDIKAPVTVDVFTSERLLRQSAEVAILEAKKPE